MADGDPYLARSRRRLLPKHSVTGTEDDTLGEKGKCLSPRPMASQSEASVLYTICGNLGAAPANTERSRRLTADPGGRSGVSGNDSISSLGDSPIGDLAAAVVVPFRSGEALPGSAGVIVPPNGGVLRPAGLTSEHGVNHWVESQEKSFPGRLYYPSTAGDARSREADQKSEEQIPDHDLENDEPHHIASPPTYFLDAMAVMREPQRSSFSSKSEDLNDGQIPDNLLDMAKSSEDVGTDNVPPTAPLPPPHDSSDQSQGSDLISPSKGSKLMVPGSTTGYSSVSASNVDSSSFDSASVLQNSTYEYGTAASSVSSRIRPHQCEKCDKSFKLAKDRDRHFQSIHQHQPKKYKCRCSYNNTRKDVIKRHVETKRCASKSDDPDVCICNFETSSVDLYLEHIKDCDYKKKPRGRPKKQQI